MALVIGAAGLGNTIGIGLGRVLRKINPVDHGRGRAAGGRGGGRGRGGLLRADPAVLLGLTAGVAQAMGKISLDALIQRDVPERHRTSAFARSETLLQLSWVIGGFIGIALPLKIGDNVVPELGLACWRS